MSRRARKVGRRVPRLVAVYAAVILAGTAALLLTLSRGNDLDRAPQLAPASAVTGPGTDCLGSEIVAIQSGIYLDLHRPGDSGAEGLAGERLLRGTVSRSDGGTTMTGSCARGSALAGRPVTADLTVGRGHTAEGSLDVGGTTLEVGLDPLGATDSGRGAEPPLRGEDLIARTFLALAVVLVAARLVGLVFSRIRQTRVMGEIVAGILLGPSLLGNIWPEAGEYLFPATVTGLLNILGQIGLILFMFLVGLDLNKRLVRGMGHRVVVLSHVSIVVPFVIGAALALLLYPLVGSGKFAGFALFMGAAMAITAFPVLARILRDTGLDRTPIGTLALTSAAVDDMTAWCILAGVVAVVDAGVASDVAMTLLLTLAFVSFMAFAVRPGLRHLTNALHQRGTLSTTLLPGVLVCVLLSAWVTEGIGIHVIFGAFILGVAMPRTRWVRQEIQKRLEDVTSVFLLPVFFAVVGLSTRISLLDRTALWLLTAAVIAAACFGKLGGSVFAARLLGYDWRQSTAVGILMNTRGLTEIVILTVGRDLGVVSPALFAMMVLMALVTTFMATPLLSLTYPTSRARSDAEAALLERDGTATSAAAVSDESGSPSELSHQGVAPHNQGVHTP